MELAEARGIQERLRSRVVERDAPVLGELRRVAGVDVAYGHGSARLFAAAVVLDAERLEVVDVARARGWARFPYVPGYLSFREIPPLLEALGRLSAPPDLVVCDGHGRAHPRRFGLACHLGVLLDLPAIGCAKSRLVGCHREPGPRRGCHAALRDQGEVIGDALRTRSNVKPVYVSVGHRITRPTARRILLRLSTRARLPEPIRAAHAEVGRMRRACERDERRARRS